MSRCARTTYCPKVPMLTPEKISAPAPVLKQSVASDEDLIALQPHLQPKHFPRRVNCSCFILLVVIVALRVCHNRLAIVSCNATLTREQKGADTKLGKRGTAPAH
jgi:hypothetical protein